MDKQRHGPLTAKVKTARQHWHRPQTLQRSLVKLEAMEQTTAASLPSSSASSSSSSLALGRSTQCKQWRWLPGGSRSCAEDGMRHRWRRRRCSPLKRKIINKYVYMRAHTCCCLLIHVQNELPTEKSLGLRAHCLNCALRQQVRCAPGCGCDKPLCL